MDIKLAHALALLGMFGSCFVACLLPSVIHFHAEPHSLKRRILNALKRYCNCLSGGVFAGAFFTQFYPLVVKEFTDLFPSSSIWLHPLQLGPSIVFLGFVMTGLLERLVDVVLTKLRHQKKLAEGHRAMGQELNSVVDGSLTVANGTDEEDNAADTDLLSPPDGASLAEPAKHPEDHYHRSHGRSSSQHSHAQSRNHHHHHHHVSLEDYHGAARFIVLVSSLGTHSIFEGLSLGLLKQVGPLFNMFFAIVVHEVLMALALGISLSQQKMRLRSRILFCVIFSVIIPVGQVIGFLIQQSPDSHSAKAVIAVLQAVAAGTFLHVMFMEILPEEMGSHFGLVEAFWVVFGYILIPLTSLATNGDHDAEH